MAVLCMQVIGLLQFACLNQFLDSWHCLMPMFNCGHGLKIKWQVNISSTDQVILYSVYLVSCFFLSVLYGCPMPDC